jgi:hypothetical protein
MGIGRESNIINSCGRQWLIRGKKIIKNLSIIGRNIQNNQEVKPLRDRNTVAGRENAQNSG